MPEDVKSAQDRLACTADNLEWLRQSVARATDREAVVEWVPSKRPSPLDFFGSPEEAYYRVTIRGVTHAAQVPLARVALRDEEWVATRVRALVTP